MRIAFREKPHDILVVLVLSLALVPLVVFAVTGPLRVALGLLFVLFLPGYSLIAALFPKDKDIDWIERVALSFGLSIAVVPLLGLLLNYTPWGIRLEPIVVTVLLFTLGMCAAAYYRRMLLPVEERLSFTLDVKSPMWKEYALLDKVLTVALVLSIITAAGVLGYVLVTPRQGERFTEFYILDSNGKAQNYPSRLNVSESASVIIGIVNHESEAVNYTLLVSLVTVQFVYNVTTGRNDTVELGNVTLDSRAVLVDDGQTWERPFNFSIAQSGDYKLRFLLYRDPPQGEPQWSLHLWIKVS
jgi:uncharacterized membrane protein